MLLASRVVGDRHLCTRQDPNNPEIIASVGNLSLNIFQMPGGTVSVVCIPTGKWILGKGRCVVSELNPQIDIDAGDGAVMGGVVDFSGECGAVGAAIQVQGRDCSKSAQGQLMLLDDKLQPLLNQLKSVAAERIVQQNLVQLSGQLTSIGDPEALMQEQARRQRMLLASRVVETDTRAPGRSRTTPRFPHRRVTFL